MTVEAPGAEAAGGSTPTPAPFCRDCLKEGSAALSRCPHCGSPRLLRHPERGELSIAHIDCDAFFAAVEKRDDPSLVDKPVIVGGGRRGVVSTACYIARTYGVRSAMPMFKALKACPDAVVIKPNMEKYATVGRQIRQMMRDLTPLVEPLSIDEAFLDLEGTRRLHGASADVVLARFARKVEDELALTVSVGLSYNKFLAKIASDLDKPRGFAVIGRAEVVSFLADKPVGIIPGVGRVTQERLARDGIRTVGDIQRRDEAEMARRYGEEGLRLARLAFGRDSRRVEPERDTKSISAETTFNEDIGGLDTLLPILLQLSEKVALRLRRADFAARGITLKLKTADFRTRTRARSGFPPTQLSSRIYEIGRELLAAEIDGTRFRLIGIGASDLAPAEEADRGDLVDTGSARHATMERAIDRLRERFGSDAVQRGLVFGARQAKAKERDAD
ncbi:DNA polymerase IV [Alsobacter sp. R-9]